MGGFIERRQKRPTGGEGYIALKVPESIPWYYWRVLMSDKMQGTTLAELKYKWTLDDLLDAWEMLDAYEDAERAASQQRKSKA